SVSDPGLLLLHLHEEERTWHLSYVPVKDFVQETLTWTVVHDQRSGAIFRRDHSGDHVLLSEYRDRVSVLKNSPGDVSLHILKLEISDRGTYTCQVTWRATACLSVAVTKPVIRAGELGLMVPAGARTSLTCVASGSPPISYRWFLGEPGGKARQLSSQAELTFDSVRPSDSGKYYCEAENRVGAGVAQRSDAVELTVRGESPNQSSSSQLQEMIKANSLCFVILDLQKTHLSLYLVILIAVVCGAVVFLILSIILCIRKPKYGE
uniref:Ig-like domain-containing protein n=1 Tax=Dromaius novaehollandiae TaxID=8790 RepID=A0A8C4JK73_DRONO